MVRLCMPLVVSTLALASCDEFEPPDDPACRYEEQTLEIEAPPIQRVDLAIWIDDSPTMADEQAAIAEQIPGLLRELLDPPDLDGDTRPDYPPIQDLNVGIVSPGAATTSALPGCLGPDGAGGGCLLRSPMLPTAGCEEEYSPFQSWDVFHGDAGDVERVTHDIGCLASLGTQGCPFEQPFAVMTRAMTEQAALGGCNEGFVRDGALLLLLWISDEDDGSASAAHPELFDPAAPLGAPDVRAALHPELLEPVDSFTDVIRRLKPVEEQNKIVLGMIVGVPVDAPECTGSGDELTACLALPAMEAEIDPADPTRLLPSCSSDRATAYPPRRFVELAQHLGANALVTSICRSDWTDALSGITQKLMERLPAVCFYHDVPLTDGECEPACTVVEALFDDRPCGEDPACPASWCPAATVADVEAPPPCVDPATGTECRPLKRDLGVVVGADGVSRRQCLIRRAARTYDAATGMCGLPQEDGWVYYPSEESSDACAQILFTVDSYWGGLQPGSHVTMRCGATRCDASAP
jgi:hypothetical protein